jgi:hypothetical protein
MGQRAWGKGHGAQGKEMRHPLPHAPRSMHHAKFINQKARAMRNLCSLPQAPSNFIS